MRRAKVKEAARAIPTRPIRPAAGAAGMRRAKVKEVARAIPTRPIPPVAAVAATDRSSLLVRPILIPMTHRAAAAAAGRM